MRAKLLAFLAAVLVAAAPSLAATLGPAVPAPPLLAGRDALLAELELARSEPDAERRSWAVAHLLLASGLESARASGAEGFARNLEAQERNLLRTQALETRLDAAGADRAAFTRALVESALGWDLAEPVAPAPAASSARPSELLARLAAAHGRELSPADDARARMLDEVREPLGGALQRQLAAFVAYDALARAPGASEAAVASAHGALLEASLALAESLDGTADVSALLPRGLAEEVRVASVPFYVMPISNNCYFYALGFSGPDLWLEDTIISTDLGGDDTYENNAGGSTCGSYKDCGSTMLTFQIHVDRDGFDDYGKPASPRSCGVNGGGYYGRGNLLDLGFGEDDYWADDMGVNGGGYHGDGWLLDQAGASWYRAGELGTNGGASREASGRLIDAEGDDVYDATVFAVKGDGTNGGAVATALDTAPSRGFLLDAFGRDWYFVRNFGGNGGAVGSSGFGAFGRLVDLEQPMGPKELFLGKDVYDGGFQGINGGAVGNAVGYLRDAAGNDLYLGEDGGVNGGVNAHKFPSGVATLLDTDGDDIFDATFLGANGGVYGKQSFGILLNARGRDLYRAVAYGTNGGADTVDPAWGHLIDLFASGLDEYRAGSQGANGAGTTPGLAFGLLYDDGGLGDEYWDSEPFGCNGSGTDVSVVPKCSGVDVQKDV